MIFETDEDAATCELLWSEIDRLAAGEPTSCNACNRPNGAES
jgi:hypothetical protein